MRKQIFFLWLLTLTCVFSYASEPVTTDEYEKSKEKLDLSKTKNIYQLRDPGTTQYRNRGNNIPSGIGLQPVFKGIGIILLIVIVVSVIVFIAKDAITSRKVKKEIFDLDHIEDIEKIPLSSLYNQAINDKDYRLAIRILFLQNLQQLSADKIISWKQYKTNRNYQQELKAHPLSNDFQNIVDIFEHFWYGKNELSEKDFTIYHPVFTAFQNKINKE